MQYSPGSVRCFLDIIIMTVMEKARFIQGIIFIHWFCNS